MFAAIYIPDFSLQAALRPEPELHSHAVALIGDAPAKETISQFTKSARDAGVAEGMTPTQAMARCPGISIKSRLLSQEKAAGEVLIHCAYQFSPFIEATALGVCTLDLKGVKRSIDERFGREIIDLLAGFHLQAQIGVGENPGLALQAARSARPFLAVGDRMQFLTGVPLGNIDPSPALLSVLRKWGIRTLADFIALGREQVADRLGVEGLELFDLASGNLNRPLRLCHPPDVYEEAIEFEHEIESIEPLLFILRRFLDQICRRLELIYSVVEEVDLRLDLDCGERYERVFRIPAPTNNLDTLFRVLHTHLENLTTTHPIIGFRVNAKPCKPRHHQFGLFETSLRDPNHFYETLAHLTALLGPDRVGTPIAEPTYRPDAFRMESVRFDASTTRPDVPDRMPPDGLKLRRLRPPLPVDVEFQSGRPSLLGLKNVQTVRRTVFQMKIGRKSRNRSPQGRNASKPSDRNSGDTFLRRIGFETRGAKQIQKAQGPWRSSGNWWDDQRWHRDEWDVQTHDGTLYRLSHQSDGWFVEGVYD